MQKKELLYQGKAKSLYTTNDPSIIWVEYLDQVTALNGKKKDAMVGKGILNNEITCLIFDYLTTKNITHHFKKRVSQNEQLIYALEMIPLEVVVRNRGTGSFIKRFGVDNGYQLSQPVIEFYYKADELDDPFMNDDHVFALGIATKAEVARIKADVLQLNKVLLEVFDKCNLELIDFKVEYGRDGKGEIILGDEITPDTCRLWDKNTGQQLDKDVYRNETGDLLATYREVLKRLQINVK